MALSYCILAHKNPDQLARLLRALAHPGNLLLLHYEKRAPRHEREAVARLAREIPGVHLLPSRRILWGHYSVVGVQLEAMRRALELDGAWTHFITLSGQDFPLQPQAAMVNELAASRGTSFLSFFDPFAQPYWKNVNDRVTRYHIESAALERFIRLPFIGRRIRALLGWEYRLPAIPGIRRTLPPWLRYMGGSNHVTLAREAAEYILGDPAARRIIGWLRHSGIPDESLFQSVLCHSPLAGALVNDDRRAIRWERHDAPSPATFTAADLPWLREERARGRLFARKFDANIDDEPLRALENELGSQETRKGFSDI